MKRPFATPLDWTKPFICPEGAPTSPYDIILLTDCIFSVELTPDLISTIKSLCGPKSEVYCCYEIRDQHINDIFLAQLSESFNIKRIPRSKLHPLFRNDMVEVIVCKLSR